MAFIEPLELKTWITQVLAGSPDIFLVVSLFAITMLSGYFRMNGLSMFFVLGTFILMFSTEATGGLYIMFALFGGLAAGYWISRFAK